MDLTFPFYTFFFCAIYFLIICSYSSIWISANTLAYSMIDPTDYYTTIELVCAEGYPIQEYEIITEDGYILTTHRIPGRKRWPQIKPKKNHYVEVHRNPHPDFSRCVKNSLNVTGTGIPVLLGHGSGLASDSYVLQGSGNDLAYLLVDEGYDVWMVNFRGTFYSKSHIHLKSTDPKFWDFSFHEMAIYDIANTIDFILKKTDKEKLYYIGFSQGTTVGFALTSFRPEYNSKIIGFIAMAPVVYSKPSNRSKKRSIYFNALFAAANFLRRRGDVHEIFPRSYKVINFERLFCSKESPFQDICYDIYANLNGANSMLLSRNKLQSFLSHYLAGTSLKTLIHFIQNFESGQFTLFDHGLEGNWALYGQPMPPVYPIWNITVPIAMYYSTADFYYDVKDIKLLEQQLNTIVEIKGLNNFNHIDFLWAYNAKDLVYSSILSLMKRLRVQYNNFLMY